MNDNLWKTLHNINEWIRFSEGKAIAIMATQGVFITIASQKLLEDSLVFGSFELITTVVALLFSCVSIGIAFQCLNPSLKISGGVSPLYFGSIAESFNSSREYYEYFNQSMTADNSISEELCGQIYINSRIADRKYRHVAYSIRCMMCAIVAWTIFIILRII